MATGKLIIRRNNNVFILYSPQGIKLAYVYLGEIRDYNKDKKCITAIEKALCERWGLLTGKK